MMLNICRSLLSLKQRYVRVDIFSDLPPLQSCSAIPFYIAVINMDSRTHAFFFMIALLTIKT